METPAVQKIRADRKFFGNGLKAILGQPYINDNGTFFEVLAVVHVSVDWQVEYFLWDGISRSIKVTSCAKDRQDFMEMLSGAWPLETTNPMYEEFKYRKRMAINYNPENDKDLMVKNFDLLLRNTERILNTAAMRNESHVATLLNAYKDGRRRYPCPGNKGDENDHEGYVITALRKPSGNRIHAYCPRCKNMYRKDDVPIQSITIIPEHPAKGLRLDEIIEELKKLEEQEK